MTAAQPTATTAEAFIGVDVGGTHTDVSVVYRRPGRARQGADHLRRLQPRRARGGRGRRRAATSCRSSDLLGQHAAVHQRHDRRHQRDHAAARLARRRARSPPASATRSASPAARAPTELDDHLQLNVPDLVDRRAIAEIDERDRLVGHRARPARPRRRSSAAAKHLVEEVRRRRARDLLPVEPRQRRARAGRRGARSRSSTRTCSSPRRTGSSRSRARRAAGRRRCSTPSSRTAPTST